MAVRLSGLERARIEAMGSEGVRWVDIAARLGRHPSTVWRELGRGRGRDGVYRAERAQAAAQSPRAGGRPRASKADVPLPEAGLVAAFGQR